MKVICDRGALADALNLVNSVVLSRTPKPVLMNVKLTTQEGALVLAATDLEVAVNLAVNQVEVADEGAVLLPADKITAIVRESVDPTLTLETDENAAHIRGTDSHYTIFAQGVEEFPPVEPFSGQADFEINAGQLRETSRYAINGVLLEREGKKLNMIATDGRRLAVARGACNTAAKDAATCIIPTKALSLLAKLLDDSNEAVKVKVAGNQVHFGTDRATLTSNLVEGNFPPYKDVIPKDHDRKATFATDVLASAVKRAALLTNEESKGVKFSFTSQQLKLSSRAPEMGEAEVNVPAEAYTGEPIDIGFNPQFVTDALKIIHADQVNIELKAPNKPGTLRVGSDFLYVVMPVSLG
jgi:DNA polymerase III subunit beta